MELIAMTATAFGAVLVSLAVAYTLLRSTMLALLVGVRRSRRRANS